jgi:cell division transport system permease protein
MATTIARILKYGLQSITRNWWLSLATVNVMVLALIVFEGLIVFNVVKSTAIVSLEDKIDISVYIKTNVQEDAILKLAKALEELPEVKSVEYISRERALEILQERHKDDPTIPAALAELEGNPLAASLSIKATDPTEYETIASYLEAQSLADTIDKVSYSESKGAIDRLTSIVSTVERVGLILTLFLALTAVLVTFNTVSLAIYSNREEIGIMRLVGASNLFINGPYIVEAIVLAVFAALVSLIITGPLLGIASPHLQNFIPELDLGGYFFSNLPSLLGYQLLFGVLLGIISAVVAIRRYLRI